MVWTSRESDASLFISELAIPHECPDIGNAGKFHFNIKCDLGVLHVINGSVSPAMRAYFFFLHKGPFGWLKGLAKPGDSLAENVLASVCFLSV